MSRPRIRTLKPELWQDEKVGTLSRDARLLFVGLVTMADDEGRLRALPALILGHVFPYDADALRKVAGWLDEVAAMGLVRRYEVAGTPYVQVIGWSKHQRINRPTPSDLPPGPFSEGSMNGTGGLPDGSPPRARRRAPADRIGRERNGTPPYPPRGNRTRDREDWEDNVVAWAESVGVSGPRRVVLTALKGCGPWKAGDAPAAFRSHVGQFFSESLTVEEAA